MDIRIPASLSRRPYFFDRGIRFRCTRCGRCCTGSPGIVRLTHAEAEAAARYLDMPFPAFAEQMLKNVDGRPALREAADGRCLCFDGGCAIYAVRPRQCRTFPFWFDNLRSEENWKRTAAACPGIGEGKRFSREHILRVLAEEIERPG